MDNIQTLGSIFSRQDLQRVVSFNTYLTVFSINLSHRFPDISDINQIDYEVVRSIGEFSLACTTVALEVWDRTNEQKQRVTRRAA